MLRFLIQKLLHKKWMVISLLTGNILLIAIAVSYPMYQQAVADRMLQDELSNYAQEQGHYSGTLVCRLARKKSNQEQYQQMLQIFSQAQETLETELLENIRVSQQMETSATYLNARADVSDVEVRLSSMTDLEQHITMISGDLYGQQDDSVVEAIVSEGAFINLKLLVGDELQLSNVYNEDGTPVTVRITGVFRCSDSTDPYWVNAPDDYDTALFMEEERFVELFDEKRNQNTTYMTYCYGILDERQISADDVELLEKKTTQFLSDLGNTKATVSQPEYLTVFEQYRSKERRVTVTLAILQVPVVVLLLAFIFMISGQMLSMEQNEISILKSRGAGRNQIILLYLMQAVLLNIISFIAALPLGALLCQMLGSANAFLEFVRRRSLSITISARVLGYGAGAMALSVLVTVLPVLRYSKVSIVNLKQGRSRSGKALWQKLYADIVLLGISLYGLYTFSIQKDELAVKVLSGAALDPMLYLSSSLFILGSGLFVLRLWPWILKGIYRVGQKRWKPETYAAFLQMIRNGRKQQFMMIFLVLTVALGIFNATVARTILSNGEDNLRYQLGADVVLSQEWKDNQGEIMAGMADSIAYTEPDSDQFTSVSGVEYMARVLKDTVQVHGQEAQGIEAELMAITTNEFGMVVYDDGANAYSLVQYLNVLSTNSRAVLVSENFKSMYGYQLGDEISYGDLSGTIYGFFTYFPSYVPTQTVTWSDSNVTKQDCFMIVANLSYVQSQWGVTPYELWFKMEDGDAEPLMDYIEENGINVEAFDSRQNQNYTLHNDPLFQGTNGVLTMSFIVILLLCGVGFLIYWILSIRERELLFGVLRAMGLSGKGVIRMLLTEQLLGSILFIASGVGIGIGASVLYVPLIALAYMAQTQTLPLKLVIQPGDLVRLLVLIGLMLVVCMTVLIRLVFDMKITNALKLGED